MAIMEKVERLLGRALQRVRSGDEKLASHQPQATAGEGRIEITSTAFAGNAPIPLKYSQDGQNVSPALSWKGVPANASELVLVCEDPDAPFPSPFVHWIMYHIPPQTPELPENLPQTQTPGKPAGATQAKNSAKTWGYTGPKPPKGHGVHHYHFQIFAVDAPLNVDDSPDVDDLLKAMSGHVLAQGELVGTYERN